MKAMVKKTSDFPYAKAYGIVRDDGVMLHEFSSDGISTSSWGQYFAFDKKHAEKMCEKINNGELPIGRRHGFCFGRIGFWGCFHSSK